MKFSIKSRQRVLFSVPLPHQQLCGGSERQLGTQHSLAVSHCTVAATALTTNISRLKTVDHIRTSTGVNRSCAALASFSCTFDLILFQALNIEFIFEKIWFGLVSIDSLNKRTKQMVFGLL